MTLSGLQTQSAAAEDLWQQSMSLANGERPTITSSNERISPWMNVLLLGVFVAIPYLIHKISSSIRQNQIKGNYFCISKKTGKNLTV